MADKLSWKEKLNQIVESACESVGCKLYDFQFNKGGRILTVFITKPDSEAIRLEDCEKVSKSLSEMLDDQDVIPGDEYSLDVSSPGVERKLTRAWHFIDAVDSKIQIKLFESLGRIHAGAPKKILRQKSFEAVLKSADEQKIIVDMDELSLEFSYAQLANVNVIYDF
ncbi:MAG: ribosome maturation factor RimP [Bdellovibrionales bacterium]